MLIVMFSRISKTILRPRFYVNDDQESARIIHKNIKTKSYKNVSSCKITSMTLFEMTFNLLNRINPNWFTFHRCFFYCFQYSTFNRHRLQWKAWLAFVQSAPVNKTDSNRFTNLPSKRVVVCCIFILTGLWTFRSLEEHFGANPATLNALRYTVQSTQCNVQSIQSFL